MVIFGDGVRKGCSVQVLEHTALSGRQNLCGEKSRISKSLQSRGMPHIKCAHSREHRKTQSISSEINSEK